MKNNIEENNKKQNSLDSCCVYFGENKNDFDSLSDKFVGIKYFGGEMKIYFPVGYAKPKDEKERRRDILNLLQILRSFGEKDKNLLSSQDFSNQKNVAFPINAYIFIIQDFLLNGYYSKKETYYKKNGGGKANWSRTIKLVKPQIFNGHAFYLDFITQKKSYSEDELIAKIHRFCVHECFSKLGFLFSSFMPQKYPLKLSRQLCVSAIKKAAAETFNENILILFKNMVDVLNFTDSQNEDKNFIYGTENFHHIWESIVDEVFGESDKEKFYPKVYWKLFNEKGNLENAYDFPGDEKRNSLRPDTIMIQNRGKTGQRIFVLDSKYYRYGTTKIKNHLPSSESIVKQLAYAKYIEKECQTLKGQNDTIPKDVKLHFEEDSIFNAFIMPSDLSGENCVMKNIGFASADFVFSENENEAEKRWHKIHGILLDTKFLMQNHAKNVELVVQLADLIEQSQNL